MYIRTPFSFYLYSMSWYWNKCLYNKVFDLFYGLNKLPVKQ